MVSLETMLVKDPISTSRHLILIAIKASNASYTIDFGKCDREVEMAGVFQATRLCAVLSAVALFLTAVASPSYAETGRVRLKVTSVGFIVGIGGGSGTLTFRGKTYPLRISGVSAGTIGASGMDLVGTASNLRTAADIAGTYSAASAGIAVAGGGKAATLQNSNGVVLSLQGSQVGFQANLSVSGVTISLQ
jgi:hypothetical protein